MLLDSYLRRQRALQQQQAVLVINAYAEAVNSGKRGNRGSAPAAGATQAPAERRTVANYMPPQTPRDAPLATAEEVAALLASNGSNGDG